MENEHQKVETEEQKRLKQFRKHLAEAIKVKGTAVALAAYLECSGQTVSNWKNYGIDHPTGHSREKLKKLAALLNLPSVDALFQEVDIGGGVLANRDLLPLHRKYVRRFKQILESPKGAEFIRELLDDPVIGDRLIEKIDDFNA